MKRNLMALCGLAIVATVAYHLFLLYDNRFPYGRMWETPAIKPHEKAISYMAPGTVPFSGGEAEYRHRPGVEIIPPFSLTDAGIITAGRKLYGIYCVHCHGKYLDGNGTVGQSFAPLPGNLRSSKVKALAPGQIFKEISYGIPNGRQPALATTVAVLDRWRIIAYLKSISMKDRGEISAQTHADE